MSRARPHREIKVPRKVAVRRSNREKYEDKKVVKKGHGYAK